MARPVRIEIIGLKKAIRYVNKKNVDAIEGMSEAVNKASLILIAEVKESISGHRTEKTSVKTGRFLNTVSISKLGKNGAKIFSPLSYAIHLEEGTSKFTGRHHFRNSADRKRAEIKEKFGLIIKSKMKKK